MDLSYGNSAGKRGALSFYCTCTQRPNARPLRFCFASVTLCSSYRRIRPRFRYREPRPHPFPSRLYLSSTSAVSPPVVSQALPEEALQVLPSSPVRAAPASAPASRRTSSAAPESTRCEPSSSAPVAPPSPVPAGPLEPATYSLAAHPSSPFHPRRSSSPGSSGHRSAPAVSASSPCAAPDPSCPAHPYPSVVPAAAHPLEEAVVHPVVPPLRLLPSQHHTASPLLHETSSHSDHSSYLYLIPLERLRRIIAANLPAHTDSDSRKMFRCCLYLSPLLPTSLHPFLELKAERVAMLHRMSLHHP